ncbi:putative secretory aspartyl proteinase sap2p [Diaporthe ampelina]|uniref:Putative secretory aspartyl proteinase sap2p n=1 Tax=Diaporthe ampelina TaxID=1214573 RepID=A0A0G2H2N7_9PEZI|nr:putative secretory aspartyl proteinase sap2p [Diaporthe ampelina]
MKTGLVAMSVGAAVAQTVPTVHIPLNLRFGDNHKTSTDVFIPSLNTTLEVVYDQGSENFFVFGPNSIANWGLNCLGCQGPCNASVPAGDYLDYTHSSTASDTVPFGSFYAYGGFDKIYNGEVAVNETFDFVNSAGLSSKSPDTRVAIVNYLQQRIGDSGTCSPVPIYDLGILGVSPYYHSNNETGRNTTGPSFRQDLLERGLIDAPVQSLWFDEPPADVRGTYTGGGLQGGIDTSKFEGPLVKVPNAWEEGRVGYYVPVPKVSSNGIPIATGSAGTEVTSCLVDSGTHNDDIPIADEATFFNATGIRRSDAGHISWPGTCDSIPADKTIDLTFDGVNEGESITIKVPIRAYVRLGLDSDEEGEYCSLSIEPSGCILGSPFATAAFFAADDERGEIAFAQGAVSKAGSAVDEASVIARIP